MMSIGIEGIVEDIPDTGGTFSTIPSNSFNGFTLGIGPKNAFDNGSRFFTWDELSLL